MKNKRIIALIAFLTAGVLCFAACAQTSSSKTAAPVKKTASVEKMVAVNNNITAKEEVESAVDEKEIEKTDPTEQAVTNEPEKAEPVEQAVTNEQEKTKLPEKAEQTEPVASIEETEEKPWLKYGITDEEFAKIVPWELYSSYIANITKEEYYKSAPWEIRGISEDEYTAQLYYNRPKAMRSYDELYNVVMDYFIPDENYETVLEQIVPGAVAVIKDYAHKFATTDIEFVISNGMFTIPCNPDFNYVFVTDEYRASHGGFSAPRAFMVISEVLPSIYRQFPDLTIEQYNEIIDMRMNQHIYSPYKEGLVAGKISETDPKLTLDDIKQIIKESSSVEEVLNRVKMIQPYCDSNNLGMSYSPTNDLLDEEICIACWDNKIEISYRNRNYSEDDMSTILAEYDTDEEGKIWYNFVHGKE